MKTVMQSSITTFFFAISKISPTYGALESIPFCGYLFVTWEDDDCGSSPYMNELVLSLSPFSLSP